VFKECADVALWDMV